MKAILYNLAGDESNCTLFDLAFFLPGAVLYWTLHTLKPDWIATIDPVASSLEIGKTGGLFSLVVLHNKTLTPGNL